MHYEKLVKENKVQYPKAETVKHFKLKRTSSLNTILAKSCEIKKSFIENQASESRMRFKNSKYADIDELYKKSWEDVKPSTIQYCFHKAQFIRKTVVLPSAVVPNDVVPSENEIEELLDQVARFDDDFKFTDG